MNLSSETKPYSFNDNSQEQSQGSSAVAQEITIVAGAVEPAQLPAEHTGAVPVTPGLLESKGCTAKSWSRTLCPVKTEVLEAGNYPQRAFWSGAAARMSFVPWSMSEGIAGERLDI